MVVSRATRGFVRVAAWAQAVFRRAGDEAAPRRSGTSWPSGATGSACNGPPYRPGSPTACTPPAIASPRNTTWTSRPRGRGCGWSWTTPHATPCAPYAMASNSASVLTAWSLLYAALGFAWLPAVVLGVAIVLGGVYNGRRAAAALADVVESVVDLRHADLDLDLARALGADAEYSSQTGRQVTERLRKGT